MDGWMGYGVWSMEYVRGTGYVGGMYGVWSMEYVRSMYGVYYSDLGSSQGHEGGRM